VEEYMCRLKVMNASAFLRELKSIPFIYTCHSLGLRFIKYGMRSAGYVALVIWVVVPILVMI
jgi:hypothetical protein